MIKEGITQFITERFTVSTKSIKSDAMRQLMTPLWFPLNIDSLMLAVTTRMTLLAILLLKVVTTIRPGAMRHMKCFLLNTDSSLAVLLPVKGEIMLRRKSLVMPYPMTCSK